MVSLDSVYAMLARPPVREIKQKKGVKAIDNSAAISADSHEQPQSPPRLERRQYNEERQKKTPHDDRLEATLERRKNNVKDRRHDEEQPTSIDNEDDSPFPHIDINI